LGLTPFMNLGISWAFWIGNSRNCFSSTLQRQRLCLCEVESTTIRSEIEPFYIQFSNKSTWYVISFTLFIFLRFPLVGCGFNTQLIGWMFGLFWFCPKDEWVEPFWNWRSQSDTSRWTSRFWQGWSHVITNGYNIPLTSISILYSYCNYCCYCRYCCFFFMRVPISMKCIVNKVDLVRWWHWLHREFRSLQYSSWHVESFWKGLEIGCWQSISGPQLRNTNLKSFLQSTRSIRHLHQNCFL
jgi:hypothetical protein